VKIHQCAMTGDLPGVVAEVARDPRLVNLPEDYGQTPLHLAAQNCHSNVVAFLLSRNATVDARGSDDETPLHLAAQEGCGDVVTLLLNHHATINAKDKEGRTPLKRAEEWGQPAIVSMLKKNGGTE
jgi:ankyrin repeat protein